MANNSYEFTYCIRYEEKVKFNLPFKTREYAALAARYLVDLAVHESQGTEEVLDPSKFKLHYRPMKSTPSRVRTIKRGGPPHPVEAFTSSCSAPAPTGTPS
jgi:hypothetical protein